MDTETGTLPSTQATVRQPLLRQSACETYSASNPK
jgi:hypothetical protein